MKVPRLPRPSPTQRPSCYSPTSGCTAGGELVCIHHVNNLQKVIQEKKKEPPSARIDRVTSLLLISD